MASITSSAFIPHMSVSSRKAVPAAVSLHSLRAGRRGVANLAAFKVPEIKNEPMVWRQELWAGKLKLTFTSDHSRKDPPIVRSSRLP